MGKCYKEWLSTGLSLSDRRLQKQLINLFKSKTKKYKVVYILICQAMSCENITIDILKVRAPVSYSRSGGASFIIKISPKLTNYHDRYKTVPITPYHNCTRPQESASQIHECAAKAKNMPRIIFC